MKQTLQNEFLDQINQNRSIMYKVVRLYFDDEEEIKDLVQEIVIQSYKGFANFKGDSKFSTWLYRVSLNTVLSHHKKSKRRNESENNAELVFEPEEKSENADRLYRAIKALDPINKMIVTLHLEGYDNSEIADIAGISLNHVAVKLHRCREALKKTLNK